MEEAPLRFGFRPLGTAILLYPFEFVTKMFL